MFDKKDHSEDLIKIMKIIIFLMLFLMIVLVVGALYGGYKLGNRAKKTATPAIDSATIKQQLRDLSDLTTSEMIYTGLITYSDDGIPFISQTHFSMIYSANIRAGIDASAIQIDVSDDRIVITLPEAVIQDINVDPESIEFYDEQFTLFRNRQKEDVVNTITEAEKNAKEKADTDALLKQANRQAHTIVERLLANTTDDRELIIKIESESSKQNNTR